MKTADRVILERYREKGRIAGGIRPGYVLRRDAILYISDRHPDVDLESGLDSLVDQDLLKANDGGSFFFITAAGVEKIAELFDD